MRGVLALVWLSCLSSLLLTQSALAGSGGNTSSGGAHGLDPMVLGGIAILLMIAESVADGWLVSNVHFAASTSGGVMLGN